MCVRKERERERQTERANERRETREEKKSKRKCWVPRVKERQVFVFFFLLQSASVAMALHVALLMLLFPMDRHMGLHSLVGHPRRIASNQIGFVEPSAMRHGQRGAFLFVARSVAQGTRGNWQQDAAWSKAALYFPFCFVVLDHMRMEHWGV